MSIEITIAMAGIIGLVVGLAIDRNARKERDERIKELEGELTVKQNVCDSLNETVQRLRKKLDKKKGGNNVNTEENR